MNVCAENAERIHTLKKLIRQGKCETVVLATMENLKIQLCLDNWLLKCTVIVF